MSAPFGHSMRSLVADRGRGAVVATWMAIALLGGWTAWFFLARVTVCETGRARLEAHGSDIRAAAELAPEASLGRVWPGQPGRLRLAAFPWTQYGTLPVQVVTVAPAARDGLVRVELAIRPGYDARILLAHDLPGTVEIEVERLSPAALVLRAAGRFLGSPLPRGSPRKNP